MNKERTRIQRVYRVLDESDYPYVGDSSRKEFQVDFRGQKLSISRIQTNVSDWDSMDAPKYSYNIVSGDRTFEKYHPQVPEILEFLKKKDFSTFKFDSGGRVYNDQELLEKYRKKQKIGFSARSHLKAKGLIPRSDGSYRVSEKYEHGGSTLLASNGKPSNLTPEQYKLADGTNTTFDSSNPDIRYAKGGETKKYKIKVEEDDDGDRTKIYIPQIGSVTLVQTYPEYEFMDDISDEQLDEIGLYEGDTIGKIEHLQIEDKYKGQGYAKVLMREAIQVANKKGLFPLYLNASPMGSSGLKLNDLTKFYESLGFEVFLEQGNNNLMILDMNNIPKAADGMLVGNSHAEGGIKIKTPEGMIEAEGGETIINKRSMASDEVLICEGTPKEIASKINEYGDGVQFAEGGNCRVVSTGETISSSTTTMDNNMAENGMQVTAAEGMRVASDMKKYTVTSLYDSDISWQADENDLQRYVIESMDEFDFKPGESLIESMSKMGFLVSTNVYFPDSAAEMAARGTIVRSTDASVRPSPSISATIFDVGTRMTGNDGNTWEIVEDSRGVHRWKRVKMEDGGVMMAADGIQTKPTQKEICFFLDEESDGSQLWAFVVNDDMDVNFRIQFENRDYDYDVPQWDYRSESTYFSTETGNADFASGFEMLEIFDKDGEPIEVSDEMKDELNKQIEKVYKSYFEDEAKDDIPRSIKGSVKFENGGPVNEFTMNVKSSLDALMKYFAEHDNKIHVHGSDYEYNSQTPMYLRVTGGKGATYNIVPFFSKIGSGIYEGAMYYSLVRAAVKKDFALLQSGKLMDLAEDGMEVKADRGLLTGSLGTSNERRFQRELEMLRDDLKDEVITMDEYYQQRNELYKKYGIGKFARGGKVKKMYAILRSPMGEVIADVEVENEDKNEALKKFRDMGIQEIGSISFTNSPPHYYARGGKLTDKEKQRFEELNEKVEAYLRGETQITSKELSEHAKLKHKYNSSTSPEYRKQMKFERDIQMRGEFADGGDVKYRARGGKVKKTKGAIGKSGTQYGYTLEEWEEMARERGLLVSPEQWWKSQEGKPYTDSFGRKKKIGQHSGDERQSMDMYGYLIANGLDLGSKIVPESAKKFVEENNYSKFADGGDIEKANLGYLLVAEKIKGIAPKSFDAADEKVAERIKSQQYADGGDVKYGKPEFIDYKGESIMFEPINNEYYVNDEMFYSLEDAKKYIDAGSPLSEKMIDAYRHGLFEKGGSIDDKKVIAFIKSLEKAGLMAKGSHTNQRAIDTIKSIVSMSRTEFEEYITKNPNRNVNMIYNEYQDWVQTYADGGGVGEKDEYELKVSKDSKYGWQIQYRKKGLFSFWKSFRYPITAGLLVDTEDFLGESFDDAMLKDYFFKVANKYFNDVDEETLQNRYSYFTYNWGYLMTFKRQYVGSKVVATKSYLKIVAYYPSKWMAELVAKILSENNDAILKKVIKQANLLEEEREERKKERKNYMKPSYFANGGGVGDKMKSPLQNRISTMASRISNFDILSEKMDGVFQNYTYQAVFDYTSEDGTMEKVDVDIYKFSNALVNDDDPEFDVDFSFDKSFQDKFTKEEFQALEYALGSELADYEWQYGYADGGDLGDTEEQLRQKMNISTNTKTGHIHIGGLKRKNILYKDEKGFYLIDGYGKFMGKRYPIKKYFTNKAEIEVLERVVNEYANGGDVKKKLNEPPSRVSGQKIVVFSKKVNPQVTITVKTYPNGQITDIENEYEVRFPYSVGQVLNMGHRTWACSNGYMVNDEDPCGEKKIFGMRASDIPPGHELRTLFPHKFRK